MQKIDINYEEFKKQGTGSHDRLGEFKVVEIPFDKFLVKIRLSSTDVFLGIEEIVVNKDFLSYSQQFTALSASGYHDVEDYYLEEKE